MEYWLWEGGIYMGYCFMTFEKIRTKASMTNKYNHNYREMEVLNADPSMAHLNEELVSLGGKNYTQAFDEKIASLEHYKAVPGQLPHKIRKNAVLALEVVTTFSREDREHVDIEQWKKDNVEWLRQAFNANPEKYGDNVLSVMYHGDENGNVHCHAFVVPIDDKGKLNSSYYIDGRQKVIALQDSYGKMMKERHNLNRGLKGSPATHQDIRKFYTALNQEISKELPTCKEQETASEYRSRISDIFENLNLKIFGLEKKLERKEIEGKAFDIEQRIEYYHNREEVERLRYENQQIKKDIESLGDLNEVKEKIQFVDTLDTAFQEYPDRKKAKEIYDSMHSMLSYIQNSSNTLDSPEAEKEESSLTAEILSR